jgi:hypothetical protein
MSEARIIYTPRPDATPESEVAALASVYRFLLDCHAKKKGGPAPTPDGVMKGFGISEKEKGGEHVKQLPDSSSGIVH